MAICKIPFVIRGGIITRGRFEGLTDEQWQMIEVLLPKEPIRRGKGCPHAPWRQVCNTNLWVSITGSRWCDIPKNAQWGSRPGVHRWLGRWQEDGTLDKVLRALVETAELAGLLYWERLAANVFFQGVRGEAKRLNMDSRGREQQHTC